MNTARYRRIMDRKAHQRAVQRLKLTGPVCPSCRTIQHRNIVRHDGSAKCETCGTGFKVAR